MGEHQLDKLGVTGSSPVPPTIEKPSIRRVFRYEERGEARHGDLAWQRNGNTQTLTLRIEDLAVFRNGGDAAVVVEGMLEQSLPIEPET